MKNIAIVSALMIASAPTVWASVLSTDAERQRMDAFISDLMERMTLDEKIGQLNLLPSEDIVTGNAIKSNIGAAVAAGSAGGTFNIKGASKIRELQRIAVEKSRLGDRKSVV